MQQAIDWLIDNQKPTGEFYIEADADSNNFARLYSHAIATLALTEAYGMTQDETLAPRFNEHWITSLRHKTCNSAVGVQTW